MKMKVCTIVTTLALSLSCAPLVVNANPNDYTSTDPNKNSWFNRANAKYYAETYGPLFETPYEGTGSGTTGSNAGKYYNYYSAGGDCTNFASQVLKYGGMSMTGSNRDSISSWFYRGSSQSLYSSTWTGAHQFRQHWGNVNGSGSNAAYSYKVYTVPEAINKWTLIYYDLYEGDIVQHADSTGLTKHSRVIHDYNEDENLFFAQHSTSSSGCYKDANLLDYLNGLPSNYYFFTYQIKNGYGY